MHHRHHRHRWQRHFERAFAHGCGSPDASERWAEDLAEQARRFAHRFEEEVFGAAGLGVRRPLRFLAWKLALSDEQTAALARILERLKLERAQAALDQRKAAADLADAVEAAEFARAKVEAAGELRSAAAQRVEAAVAAALAELHALLDAEQRARLAELVRTGAIRI
jgi:Spy/CpxP family protein refolding chaperone